MRLEALPKFFSPKSMHIGDTSRSTASDALTITDVMASLGFSGLQAKPGIELFLAKAGINKPDNAVEYLYQYALSQAHQHRSVEKWPEDVKRSVLRILAKFAYEDYARSAASTRQCDCCGGEGFIDAEVFTTKITTPRGAAPVWAKTSRNARPSDWDKVRQVRETVRVMCPTCNGKRVLSNSCRCGGRGKVLDQKKTKSQGGIPVYKPCEKCYGLGYIHIPAETVRRALADVGLDISQPTWSRTLKPFYEKLITNCYYEENCAEKALEDITR